MYLYKWAIELLSLLLKSEIFPVLFETHKPHINIQYNRDNMYKLDNKLMKNTNLNRRVGQIKEKFEFKL